MHLREHLTALTKAKLDLIVTTTQQTHMHLMVHHMDIANQARLGLIVTLHTVEGHTDSRQETRWHTEDLHQM